MYIPLTNIVVLEILYEIEKNDEKVCIHDAPRLMYICDCF